MSVEINNLLQSCLSGRRIEVDEAFCLFQDAPVSQLMYYADLVKRIKTGQDIYFIRNYHIEPTNVCVFQCRFCSFSVDDKSLGWSKSHEEILKEVAELDNNIREIHIVGGSNPEYDLDFYVQLLREIKKIKADVHIKAFTAAEIYYMSQLAEINIENALNILRDAGLDSIPGGGAEIFDHSVRKKICPDKISADQWLQIHEMAHSLQLKSNATMLFGHLESVRQRFEHMDMIRQLQDRTAGFSAFIPLKFKNRNNKLSEIQESNMIEDLKMFALSRLFFDNIQHLKIYWPAFGKKFASLALSCGADDLDGTIENSTRIYSMAGAEEHQPDMTVEEASSMIRNSGFIPVERDSFYCPV
jgi:aminodeoxyfutalosine synthase